MAGPVLVPLLGDQLSRDLASLRAVERADALVVMAEVADEAGYVRHHKQKIALLFSAMRHFADELREAGWRVRYQRLDDEGALPSITAVLAEAARTTGAVRLVAVEGGEHRVRAYQRGWAERLGLDVELLPDDRFVVAEADFLAWAKDRRGLRMEDFYRWQRKTTEILMEGDHPAGGRWNYDAQNRAPAPPGLTLPDPPHFPPDKLTHEVLRLVEQRFGGHFGTLDGFGWPVTRAQALEALERFVADRLPLFGRYQDAMLERSSTLYHALLSTSMNCGLLSPRGAIDAAVAAHARGEAPLSAVEGFVRQILGWREYVRGIWALEGPDYPAANALGHRGRLPDFYWRGGSGMACFDAAFRTTHDRAYAHHIQRLMVLGNFALIAGVDPAHVHEWFLIVYADAYEWVEAPNVIGMSQHADGGRMASKPYAAGSAYIDRMSDHCRSCRFDPKAREGPRACPFGVFYWDFVARHADRLASNRRTVRAVQGWRRFDTDRRRSLLAEADRLRLSYGV